MRIFFGFIFVIAMPAFGQTKLESVAKETLVIKTYELLKLKPRFEKETNCNFNKRDAVCASYHLEIKPYSVSVEHNLRRIAKKYGAALISPQGDSEGFTLLFFRRYGRLASPKVLNKDFVSGMTEKEFNAWIERIVACSEGIEPEYFAGVGEERPKPTGATLITLKQDANTETCFEMLENFAKRIVDLTRTNTRVERVTDYLVRQTQE